MKLDLFTRHPLTYTTLLLSTLSYALPFDVTPDASLPFPTTMVLGTTVYATYIVKNNTTMARNANYIKYLPPNVRIESTGCGSGPTFNLAASGQSGDSCSLNLAITGAVSANDPDISNHLFVCFIRGLTCAGTKFPLDVSVLSNIGVSGINALTSLETTVFSGALNSSNKGSMWGLQGNTWAALYTGAPSSPVQAITLSTGTPVYFGGQVFNSGQYYSAWVYQYNTSSEVTSDTGFMSSTNATKLNALSMSSTNVYAGGIDSSSKQGQAWSYDMAAGTWTSLGIADTTITEVNTLIYSPVQAYVFDAVTQNGSQDVQYYNGTSWTTTLFSQQGAKSLNALVANDVGNIYAGGQDSSQAAAVWIYAGNTWTELTSPSTLGEINALALNNEGVLFAGGVDNTTGQGQVWYYNTATSNWVSMNITGSTLIQSMTINSNDLLYAGGLATGNNSGIWSMSAKVS